MERRSADLLRRQIADQERELAHYKAIGEAGLQMFLERELCRLRRELAAEEFPERRGRRAGDHPASDAPSEPALCPQGR
jgi:hypothetical protein